MAILAGGAKYPIHDDVREFLATFGKGERGGVFYISLSTLKIVDSIYASQHCVALVLGATQTNKNQFSHKKNSCTSDSTEGVHCFLQLFVFLGNPCRSFLYSFYLGFFFYMGQSDTAFGYSSTK